MKEFCTLRVKTYAYLMNDDSEKKKSNKRNKKISNKKKTYASKLHRLLV